MKHITDIRISEIVSEELKRARTDVRCEWCGKPIEPGEEYWEDEYGLVWCDDCKERNDRAERMIDRYGG